MTITLLISFGGIIAAVLMILAGIVKLLDQSSGDE